MKKVAITSKRRATLPAELCDELGIGPGDTIELERRTIDRTAVWIIHARKPDWSWLGAARRFARGKSHDLTAIERSIARGLAGDCRP